MKFAGELRIPEVDHPGIPATVLVEDTQIEIVLDGESIGRWSLYDVRARRLISKAFALDLAGEEVVFLADEPVDFAYRGVEHMAQVWAQLKSMRGPQKMMAVRKSRAGTKVSRVEELREAMEANLKASRHAAPPRVVEEEVTPPPAPTRPPPNRPVSADTVDVEPPAASTAEEEEDEALTITDPPVEDVPAEPDVEVDLEEATPTEDGSALAEEPTVEPVVEPVAEPLEEPRKVDLPVVAAAVEAERSRFERLQAEATARDQRRIEAFRAEMAKLEAERAEAERTEAERATLFENEMERLKTEMRTLKAAEAEAAGSGDEKKIWAEIDRIEESRLQLEKMEVDRLAADLRRREDLMARKAALERQEAERWEAQRREMDRLQAEAAEVERALAERAVEEKLAAQREGERRAKEAEEAARRPVAPATPEVPLTPLQKLAASPPIQLPTKDGDPAPVVVESEPTPPPPTPEPEPAEPETVKVASRAPEKEKGLLGAVKGAFSRSTAPHEHQFVTAPGTLGISRQICTECGFVSIGTSDGD